MSFLGVIAVIGCDRSTKYQNDWYPTSVGGRIEIRKLPQAKLLAQDYQERVNSMKEPKALLYSIVLQCSNCQSELKFKVADADSPLGKQETTFVSFIYTNGTNGEYQFEWMEVGAQDSNSFRVGSTARRVLLQPIEVVNVQVPRLKIVGLEGVSFPSVVVARTNIIVK